MILDYLLQIEIFLYMLEVQISVSIWKEERTERPSQFAITDTDFWVCVNPDLLIHPCSSTFSWNLLFLFEF